MLLLLLLCMAVAFGRRFDWRNLRENRNRFPNSTSPDYTFNSTFTSSTFNSTLTSSMTSSTSSTFNSTPLEDKNKLKYELKLTL